MQELKVNQGKNNIWFCGSYAHPGVPLLETAVTSAVEVANSLGCDCPWQLKIKNQNQQPNNSLLFGFLCIVFFAALWQYWISTFI